MKHRISFNPLSKVAAHRKAMLRNMLTSLFRYERIKTTKAKALVLRPLAEKMITRSRVATVHSRRIVAKDIKDKAVAHKLFTVIGPRFLSRPGGYTRILKLNKRADSSEMVLIELLQEGTDKIPRRGKKRDASQQNATSKSAPKTASAKNKTQSSTEKKTSKKEIEAKKEEPATKITAEESNT